MTVTETHFHKTKLSDIFKITPPVFIDHRGYFIESFNKDNYETSIKNLLGKQISFVQDDFSYSTKNVIRGIHGDSLTWKLVSCVYGDVYIVIVDLRDESPTFKQWESFQFSDYTQLLIPPNCGLSYLTLNDLSVWHYKQSTYYGEAIQFTYPYNSFGITWPVTNPILSERDSL